MSERSKLPKPWTVMAWLVVSGFGFFAALRYELLPGKHAAAAPRHWPSSSTVKPAPNTFNLLLFVHPRCPCTVATIGELAALMVPCESKLDAQVLFLLPGSKTEGWQRTGLWKAAQSIPGVRCLTDPDGKEAEKFGVFTSGQALLYDPEGQLVYEGGITGARGHRGDNPGKASIVSLVGGADSAGCEASCPVFGCPIREAGGAPSQR